MGDASWALSTDLTQRVPGHALIEGSCCANGITAPSEPMRMARSSIGPGGVFTINTKHLRGKTITYGGLGMRADGFGHTYIRNAVYEARRARMLLSNAVGAPIPVTGILAFVDPYDIREKAPAGEGDIPILVVRDRDVAKVFRRTPVLPPDQLERIVAAAVVPGTWHSRPTPSTPGDKITKEFLALEAAVGAPVVERRHRTHVRPAARAAPRQRCAPRTRATSSRPG